MIRSRARLVLAAAATLAAAALLALPAAASAFQTIKVEGGTIYITGDVGKTPDEVTIRFDSIKNEYVIGHDIDMVEPPPGCDFEGLGPPYNVLRCPAKGIKKIRVELGSDDDRVTTEYIQAHLIFGAPATFLPIELTALEVITGPGNDKVTSGPPVDAAAGAGTNPALQTVDLGTGIDTATVLDGTNSILFGGGGRLTLGGGTNDVTIGEGNSSLTISGGTNTITLGAGSGKAAISAGTNTIAFGDGNSNVTATGGTNTVKFGAGNSIYAGGSGADIVDFGGGNNTFAGGAGDDAARLGAGNDTGGGGAGADTVSGGGGRDTARGGPGADKLFGGAGNDRLFGGPDFDTLRGGAGRRDLCLGGGPSAIFACEKP